MIIMKSVLTEAMFRFIGLRLYIIFYSVVLKVIKVLVLSDIKYVRCVRLKMCLYFCKKDHIKLSLYIYFSNNIHGCL